MSVRNTVRLRADEANLAVGDSVKGVCPVCDGGRTHEVTFSITRQSDGLLFNCYRATCPARGFVATAAVLQTPTKHKYKVREYYHPVLPLETEDEDYFYARFEISDTSQIFRSERDEYIFPIISPRGYTRGYTVRQPSWSGSPESPRTGYGRSSVPKARCFPHSEEPMQSFYPPKADIHGRQQTLVVVEDQVSAIKVSQKGFTAVALCGTSVNADKVREWGSFHPSQVLVALDADATSEAFKIARRWGLAFSTLRVVILLQDLKDSLSEDIPEILGVE